jgi:hypothetical protein
MMRLATLIAAIGVALAVPVSHAFAVRPLEQPSGPPLANYRAGDFSFRYPATWARVDWCWGAGSIFAPLTSFTTVPPRAAQDTSIPHSR